MVFIFTLKNIVAMLTTLGNELNYGRLMECNKMAPNIGNQLPTVVTLSLVILHLPFCLLFLYIIIANKYTFLRYIKNHA